MLAGHPTVYWTLGDTYRWGDAILRIMIHEVKNLKNIQKYSNYLVKTHKNVN